MVLVFKYNIFKFQVKPGRMKTSKYYLIDLCNELLIPAVNKSLPYHIYCRWSENAVFNAIVETDDDLDFPITINTGIAEEIDRAMTAFQNADIDEEMELIAVDIFQDATLKTDLYDCIADSAILFVLLHEVSHVLRKHLQFMFTDEGGKHPQLYSERTGITLSPLAHDWPEFLSSHFEKMAEFDADAHSVILMYAMSLEIFASVSGRYEDLLPNWREVPDNPLHRKGAAQIILFGAVVALTLIEVKTEKSRYHPSPFSRVINLFDAFTQEVFKENGLIDPDDPDKGVVYIKTDERMNAVLNEYIMFAFLTALDVVGETCKVAGIDIVRPDEAYLQGLLRDFVKLMKSLAPVDLQTAEAMEYNELRNYRPHFNSLFTDFLKR